MVKYKQQIIERSDCVNQIIDFEKKGNLVRFYLGENGKQWGDDWDDAPYDCNAGTVYSEYVKEIKDVAFPFESIVLEPCDGVTNCQYSKQDMIKRKVPCLIVVPPEIASECAWRDCDFYYWATNDNVKKYYFGDEMED